MKWIKSPITTIQQTLDATSTLKDVTKGILDLYVHIGWLTGYTDDKLQVLYEQTQVTKKRIISAGLNPKPGGRYRIGIIPACFEQLHPQIMHRILCFLRREDDKWGYVNSDYYGDKINLKDITHGFTDSDIGKVIFLVEDAKAPGHNPDMPGSLLANMRWGAERDEAWSNWWEKFVAVDNIQPLNYASHSLFLLGDTICDWGNALGRVGYYDYISQPYDVTQCLCPYGCVRNDGPEWCAGSAGEDSYYAAAAVVW